MISSHWHVINGVNRTYIRFWIEQKNKICTCHRFIAMNTNESFKQLINLFHYKHSKRMHLVTKWANILIRNEENSCTSINLSRRHLYWLIFYSIQYHSFKVVEYLLKQSCTITLKRDTDRESELTSGRGYMYCIVLCINYLLHTLHILHS